MLLTDEELENLRAVTDRIAPEHYDDLPMAYSDRRRLLDHLYTLNTKYIYTPKLDASEMPEWEQELLGPMCNVHDVARMLTTINTMREQLKEKDQEIAALNAQADIDVQAAAYDALRDYALAAENNIAIENWDGRDVANDVIEWAYWEHGDGRG